MKYVMLETDEGQKLPFVFPDACTHAIMAELMRHMLARWMSSKARVVSAGFVSVGTDVQVHGESESLGGLKARPADAARIIVGESIAFMPDAIAEMMLERLKAVDTSGATADKGIEGDAT